MHRSFLKWVPLQTLVLTGAMIWLFLSRDIEDLALLGDTQGGTARALHALSSQLGHFDGGHITRNLVMFAVVGPAVELLVARWVIPALIAICAVDGYLFDTGFVRYAGFSGVAYALLAAAGVALGVKAVVLWLEAGGSLREDVTMFVGFLFGGFSAVTILVEVIVARSAGNDGINHAAHLHGALCGAVLTLFACAVPTVRAMLGQRRARARRLAAYRARVNSVQLGL